MNACASRAWSGVAVRPVPIAQTGSYASTSRFVLAGGEGNRLHLDLEHELHVARLPLLQRLTDAGDHAEAGLERGTRSSRDARIRLPEELPALGMADEGPLDTKLDEHLGRDFAGVGAARLPVHVLGVDRAAALDGRRQGCVRRAEHRLDSLR